MSQIDMQVVQEAKDLMGDKFPTMVQYFLEDAQTYIDSINDGIESNDNEKITSPAHTIKSSARQLGAMELASYAEEIEQISRNISDGNGQVSDVKDLFAKLQQSFSEAEAELKNIV